MDVITVGIGTPRHNQVAAYFKNFRLLPKEFTVGDTVNAGNQPSFTALLKAMKKARDPDVCAIAHGHPTGTGLHLRLGSAYAHTTFHQVKALANEDRKNRHINNLTDQEYKSLITLMKAVQKKRFHVIEWRGCNLGRKCDSLAAFRKFFGARVMGAPKAWSFFGEFLTGTGKHQMDQHQKNHGGVRTFTTRFSDPDGKCYCCIRENTHQRIDGGHLVADSKATLTRWVKENIDHSASTVNGRVPVHGLWDIDFESTIPGPPKVIWPSKDGQINGEYTCYLRYVR